MTYQSREEISCWALCAIIVLTGPCSYGIYYGSEKMKKQTDSGYVLLIIFMACILGTVVCMFLSNCMVFFDDCKCKKKDSKLKDKTPIPVSLSLNVDTPVVIEIEKI